MGSWASCRCLRPDRATRIVAGACEMGQSPFARSGELHTHLVSPSHSSNDFSDRTDAALHRAQEAALTLADAILDCLVHNAQRLALEGPSMRKTRA